jgi:hypothetical protein
MNKHVVPDEMLLYILLQRTIHSPLAGHIKPTTKRLNNLIAIAHPLEGLGMSRKERWILQFMSMNKPIMLDEVPLYILLQRIIHSPLPGQIKPTTTHFNNLIAIAHLLEGLGMSRKERWILQFMSMNKPVVLDEVLLYILLHRIIHSPLVGHIKSTTKR